MCLDAGAQGAREGRGGRWLSTPAAYSSARGLGEAGGGGVRAKSGARGGEPRPS